MLIQGLILIDLFGADRTSFRSRYHTHFSRAPGGQEFTKSSAIAKIGL